MKIRGKKNKGGQRKLPIDLSFFPREKKRDGVEFITSNLFPWRRKRGKGVKKIQFGRKGSYF